MDKSCGVTKSFPALARPLGFPGSGKKLEKRGHSIHRWLRKTGQGDKWIFCLTAATMAALKGEKTLTKLAQQFEVHATQITKWKAHLVDGAAGIFGGAAVDEMP